MVRDFRFDDGVESTFRAAPKELVLGACKLEPEAGLFLAAAADATWLSASSPLNYDQAPEDCLANLMHPNRQRRRRRMKSREKTFSGRGESHH
jgi:hypothetical protein